MGVNDCPELCGVPATAWCPSVHPRPPARRAAPDLTRVRAVWRVLCACENRDCLGVTGWPRRSVTERITPRLCHAPPQSARGTRKLPRVILEMGLRAVPSGEDGRGRRGKTCADAHGIPGRRAAQHHLNMTPPPHEERRTPAPRTRQPRRRLSPPPRWSGLFLPPQFASPDTPPEWEGEFDDGAGRDGRPSARRTAFRAAPCQLRCAGLSFTVLVPSRTQGRRTFSRQVRQLEATGQSLGEKRARSPARCPEPRPWTRRCSEMLRSASS